MRENLESGQEPACVGSDGPAGPDYAGRGRAGQESTWGSYEEKPNDLKSMVRRYLPEYGNYEKQDAFDKIPWDQKELDPLCHYGCQDTDYTLRLMIFFEKKL